MKQMTEDQLKALLTEAYNEGFNSSAEGFNAEWLPYDLYEAAGIENAALALDRDAQEWVAERDDKIKKLVDKA